MEFYQLEQLLVLIFTTTVVLVPVVGLTARFTLGPLIEKYAKARSGDVNDISRALGELASEVSHLRDDLSHMDSQLARLREGADFERRLGSNQ